MKVLDTQPIFVQFWLWYYGAALLVIWQIVQTYCLKIIDTFSLPILVATLTEPWKRDVTNNAKLSLDQRIQTMVWNLFSRFIGFFIRSIVLLIGGLILVLAYILGVFVICIWIVFPFAIFYLIGYSFYLLTI